MRRLLAALVLSGAAIAAPVSAQAPSPVCDGYSKTCVGGVKVGPKKPAVRPSTDVAGLPITGGELVTMIVVAGGAIAGGSILVAAGRKRRLAS